MCCVFYSTQVLVSRKEYDKRKAIERNKLSKDTFRWASGWSNWFVTRRTTTTTTTTIRKSRWRMPPAGGHKLKLCGSSGRNRLKKPSFAGQFGLAMGGWGDNGKFLLFYDCFFCGWNTVVAVVVSWMRAKRAKGNSQHGKGWQSIRRNWSLKMLIVGYFWLRAPEDNWVYALLNA